MRASKTNLATTLPFEFEAPPAPAFTPANESYGEVTVGGIATACLSRDGLAQMMLLDCLEARKKPDRQPKLVFASNGHAIALAAQDEAFRFTLGQADIIHADGQAAVFASRLLTNTPIPERSATTDFIHDASKVACASSCWAPRRKPMHRPPPSWKRCIPACRSWAAATVISAATRKTISATRST
jgi:hypothetical protein